MNLRHLPAAFALLGATAAHAADGTYADLTSFLAAAGGTSFESFESLPGRSRSLAPINTALLTVSTTSAPIGVQTGADTPDPGYGSHAVDGNHYVSVYLPNVPQGSIRINFAAPTTAFGLYLTDIGETSGQIVLSSNVGAFAGGPTTEKTTLAPDGGWCTERTRRDPSGSCQNAATHPSAGISRVTVPSADVSAVSTTAPVASYTSTGTAATPVRP